MSKKSDGLWANYLDDRWSVTQLVSGTAITASVSAPQSDKSAHVLDALSMVITNCNATGHTVTLAVRESTLGGTVAGSAILAQWKLFVPASSSAQVNPANMNLYAGKGKSILFTNDTVLGSVSSSVNASGWTDTSSDY